MKILSAAQIREADQYTILHEPISSVGLMERAASACVSWITSRFGRDQAFVILCGTGNNGGDGLAIARLLKTQNYLVQSCIVRDGDKTSPDFQENYERLSPANKTDIRSAVELDFFFEKNVILIDALFGTGLNRPVAGLAAEVIRKMNASGHRIIAIDIPSGLYCDELNNENDVRLVAHHTLSFQFPKLAFLFPENACFVREFSLLDIGLHPRFTEALDVSDHFILKQDLLKFLKSRNKAAHKGDFGHALIIAGSKGMVGAAVLASRACLRAGAGLLTTQVPACGYDILQRSVPEAMVLSDKKENIISENVGTEKYNAVAIGPGLGTDRVTAEVLRSLIENVRIPLVLDADALNLVAEHKWLDLLPANSILTPHPKEFSRFAGETKNTLERLALQRSISKKHGVYIILKGAHSSVSCPDGKMYFNSTGNPGMATAGTGDTLTGIVVSLLAQQYHPEEACKLAVFIHGLAGDLAVAKVSQESMIASDLIENIPDAFNFIRS